MLDKLPQTPDSRSGRAEYRLADASPQQACRARAYGRDLAVFHSFMKKTVPDMIILGPGSAGEGGKANLLLGKGVLKSADLLKAAGPVFDIFSYHFYGAASKRCQSMGANAMTSEDAALSEEWLSRTTRWRHSTGICATSFALDY
jgi:hypothetical protein